MAKNDNLQDFLTDVANAIRNKKGSTDLINPQNFSSEIESIESNSFNEELFYGFWADAGSDNFVLKIFNDGTLDFIDYEAGVSYRTLEYSINGDKLYVSKNIGSIDNQEYLEINCLYENEESMLVTYANPAEYSGVLELAFYKRYFGDQHLSVTENGIYNGEQYNGYGTIEVNVEGSQLEIMDLNETLGSLNMNDSVPSIGDTINVSLKKISEIPKVNQYCYFTLINNTDEYLGVGQFIEVTDSEATFVILELDLVVSGGTSGDNSKLPQLIDGSITELTAEDFGDVTEIRDYAFYYLLSLKSVEFPDGIKKIGSQAFRDCKFLSSPLYFPDSVEEIGNYAFYNISQGEAREISIPKNIKIGTSAFGVNTIYYRGTLLDWFNEKEINTYLFTNNSVNVSRHFYINGELISGEIIVPSEITSVRRYCFGYYTNNITNIVLHNNVTTIGLDAFADSNNLTKKIAEPLIIPASVTTIESSAFTFYNPSKVIFEGQVPELNNKVFWGNSDTLEYDFSNCASIPILDNTNAFLTINPNCKFYVPDALYDEWITATNWTTYASYIYKASEKVE